MLSSPAAVYTPTKVVNNRRITGAASSYVQVVCSGNAALQAQQQHATAQTRGIAPLVQSAVLTDRRHILTKDAEGNVELWDTATAAVKERFGQVHSLACYMLLTTPFIASHPLPYTPDCMAAPCSVVMVAKAVVDYMTVRCV